MQKKRWSLKLTVLIEAEKQRSRRVLVDANLTAHESVRFILVGVDALRIGDGDSLSIRRKLLSERRGWVFVIARSFIDGICLCGVLDYWNRSPGQVGLE